MVVLEKFNFKQILKGEKYSLILGIISIIRPCGIRLGTYECYTKESTSQLVLCLIDKFGMVPSSEEIKVIVADVACGLHPFLEERKHLNGTFKLYSELTFVLDTFHGDKVIISTFVALCNCIVIKHVRECCLPSGPNAKYNPRLKQFEYLRGSNLEAAEYSFKAINKHKSSTKSVFA